MAKIPPCPGDPENYVLVKTKEGYHWRKKRGSNKKAKLNTTLQTNSNATKIVSPAAKRIIDPLRSYLTGITTGRINIRIGKALRNSLKATGELHLGYLKGIEFQADHPLEDLLLSPYKITIEKSDVRIEIPIEKNTIKPANRLVTDYFFEAILVFGDASKQGRLKTEIEESPLYPVGVKGKTKCILELSLPKKEDWMLVLKVSCLEGKEFGAHTKHYRMKVIASKEPAGNK